MRAAINATLLLIFSTPHLWPQAKSTYALVHVNIIDVRTGQIEPSATVVISGTRIQSILLGETADLPARIRVLDCHGEYLIPGLWDMHVHTEGDPHALNLFLKAGITGVRDMGGDVHKLSEARHQVEAGRWSGPRILFAGPLLQGPPGTSDADAWILHNPEEAKQAVATLAALHVDFIKVHDRLTADVYYAIANAAKQNSLPFAGHVPASITPAAASDAGQASIEHFEFLPKSCVPLLNQIISPTHSLPTECTQPTITRLLELFAKNGTWLDPTVQSFRFWTPSQWKDIQSGFSEISTLIRNEHVRILAGTDWSTTLESKGDVPGWSLHDELELLVAAGFTPLEALQAATLNPAIFFHLGSFGTVERGKTADLLLLRANPLNDIRNTRQIVWVISNGKLVRFVDSHKS
jgi:imidazolonepropionase-like amidohydrolase